MIETYLEHIFDEVDSTIKLDAEQKEAVITDGDLLVVAGAGSGKTTTMVAKVKYLIEIKKVDPANILLISYTNKATEELEERIQKQFHLPISILTFHKLGLQIIKQKRNVKIQTETEPIIKDLIQRCFKKKNWRFLFHTRKYRNKKDLTPLVSLSETFMKNYKLKGSPEISKMKLSKFWKSFFKKLIKEYEIERKKYQWIDFEDMILEATKIIQKKEADFLFQYIIVDEYQDISKDRFLLLQAIKKNYHSNIIVVGDDWQSIFGFSGSEMQLFTDFKRFFPQAKSLKITNTYRNSQELIDIAGNFVMKNNIQIKKQLSSNKHIQNPVILMPYNQNKANKLKQILKSISQSREYSTVFLLGRYHQDFKIQEYPFLKLEQGHIICPIYSNLKITFLTVHSAKGLGADEVILLNCSDDIYGFPTKKKTDPILKNVETVDSSYPHAEERRVFYVALTRTKNHVYILYPKKNPSIFIKELKKLLLK